MDEFERRNRKSGELFRRARALMPSGSAHDLRFVQPFPLYFTHGRGSRKWDVDGNEYIDYGLASAALLLGHSHPGVVEAVREQAARAFHFGAPNDVEVEWASLVAGLIPSAERVRFTGSGTEATMLAIRIARAYSGKNKVLRFEGHYHGWHDYVSLGGEPPFDVPVSLGVPEAVQGLTVVLPTDAAVLERTLAQDDDIACVIVEPSGASWGTVPLGPEFMRSVRDLTTRYNVVCIFDEVITGFRWSPGGFQALHGIIPDITTMAKVVTGGLPGGAVGGSTKVMAVMDQTGESRHDRFERVQHAGTFNANALAAAAGVAALKVVATGEPQRQANRTAQMVREGFEAVLAERGVNAVVYGEASVFHLYFGARSVEGLGAAEIKGMSGELARVYRQALQVNGVDLMSRTGGLTSMAHTDDDVDQTVVAFGHAIDAMLRAGMLET